MILVTLYKHFYPEISNPIGTIVEFLGGEGGVVLFLLLFLFVYFVLFLSFTPLTHIPLDKMGAISQTTYSNIFSSMKMLDFDSNFTETYL